MKTCLQKCIIKVQVLIPFPIQNISRFDIMSPQKPQILAGGCESSPAVSRNSGWSGPEAELCGRPVGSRRKPFCLTRTQGACQPYVCICIMHLLLH